MSIAIQVRGTRDRPGEQASLRGTGLADRPEDLDEVVSRIDARDVNDGGLARGLDECAVAESGSAEVDPDSPRCRRSGFAFRDRSQC
jgi:hypothetical protein